MIKEKIETEASTYRDKMKDDEKRKILKIARFQCGKSCNNGCASKSEKSAKSSRKPT